MSDNAIFSRERLAGYEPALMAHSVALIVGAGALGQNTAQNLALAGIGEIRIVDKDFFEDHNRTRSPAYPSADEQARMGLGKARTVAHRLRHLMTAQNPVVRYAHSWVQELGDGAFKGVSVILSCVDTPSARAYLSDKARLHGIPFIEGGFEAADITLSCYPSTTGELSQTTPCWRCSHQDLVGAFSCRFYAARVEEAGFIPAIQNAAATLSGLQSEAAILALHAEMASPLESHALDLNIRTGKLRRIELSTDPKCNGLHRSLSAPPIKLATSADDTVEQLLQEVSEHFTGAPTIDLYSPLVWDAPCRCGKTVSVRSPEWLWEMSPRCEDCQGLFPVIDNGETTDSPTVYSEITADINPKVLKSTCRETGLPSLAVVEAIANGSPSKFFELAGSIDDLYQKEMLHE